MGDRSAGQYLHRVLRPRLFGYGLLYRARQSSDGLLQPLAAEPGPEALALADALSGVSEQGGTGAGPSPAPPNPASESDGDLWCVSVPFGRCGLGGRPREHIRVYGAAEAFHDTLGRSGYREEALAEEETVVFEPGLLHRLRTRPRADGRVLVAFQTEDRTPLHGHAAPVTRSGEDAAADHPQRLARAWEAFEGFRSLAGTDAEGYQRELAAFMGDMSRLVSGDPQLAQIQRAAAADGTYDMADQTPLFDLQASLLTAGVIDRVAAADAELFRFPGMFGAVAPLFPLL